MYYPTFHSGAGFVWKVKNCVCMCVCEGVCVMVSVYGNGVKVCIICVRMKVCVKMCMRYYVRGKMCVWRCVSEGVGNSGSVKV